jgi:hypothetical protein
MEFFFISSFINTLSYRAELMTSDGRAEVVKVISGHASWTDVHKRTTWGYKFNIFWIIIKYNAYN